MYPVPMTLQTYALLVIAGLSGLRLSLEARHQEIADGRSADDLDRYFDGRLVIAGAKYLAHPSSADTLEKSELPVEGVTRLHATKV